MALSFVNAFLEWAHDVLPDRFSCWHSTGPGSMLYKEIFFQRPGFFLMKQLSFLQDTSKNTLKISEHDSARHFLCNLPFCKACGSPTGGFNNV